MLRRQPITSESELDLGLLDEAPAPETPEEERPRRLRLRRSLADMEPAHAPEPEPQPIERRKLERRSIDQLRSELEWTYAHEGRFPSPPRPSFKRFRPGRMALLAVALASGCLAAVLALQNFTTAPEPAAVPAAVEVKPEPRTQILVATGAIGIGQRLTPAVLGWSDWPQGSVLDDYITRDDLPEGETALSDAVARFDIFAGDPVRLGKLVRGSDGYLSAVLDSGLRGVSVSVSAETASGGFVNPNDRVDVVLTRSTQDGVTAQTILFNVRVLAIGTRLGETGETGDADGVAEAHGEVFESGVIATLALDTRQSEIILGAATEGRLSLVLRAMADFAETESAGQDAANRAIRLSSPFWAGTSSGLR